MGRWSRSVRAVHFGRRGLRVLVRTAGESRKVGHVEAVAITAASGAAALEELSPDCSCSRKPPADERSEQASSFLLGHAIQATTSFIPKRWPARILNMNPHKASIPNSITLPKEGTDEGALARLLIVEVGAQPRDPGSVKEAMGLMKVVLENRLKNPADFYARGATTLTQVIKAHRASPQSVQFAGFQHYPNLASLQQEALDLDLKKASNMNSSFDPVRYLFATAVAVAKAPTPADPSSGGLYFWKTHPTPLGQPGYKLFRTVAGIDFFQKVVEPKKVDHHEKHATTGPMTYSHG